MDWKRYIKYTKFGTTDNNDVKWCIVTAEQSRDHPNDKSCDLAEKLETMFSSLFAQNIVD